MIDNRTRIESILNYSICFNSYPTPSIQLVLVRSPSSSLLHSILKEYCKHHHFDYLPVLFNASAVDTPSFFAMLWNNINHTSNTLSFYPILFPQTYCSHIVFFPSLSFYSPLYLQEFLLFLKRCKASPRIFLVLLLSIAHYLHFSKC